MMTSAEDTPSCGRLRPRKLSVGAPQRVTRNSESKTADEKQSKVNIQKTLVDEPLDNPVNKLLCPYCEKYFTIKPSLMKHVTRVHSSAASVKCQFCDFLESNVDGAVRHMIEKHPDDYFFCFDCRTRFQTAQDLEEHRPTCKKQESPFKKLNRNKLRANTKTVHRKKNDKQKNESSTHNKVIAEKPVFNGIVISCELKPPLQQETADIEDNITTNLILPSNKNIGSTGLEKNAVIVLDDIQWNKRIPPNFCFHNSDADQILSRLGVVHRSPRVGESSRRDWYKHIEDSTKFEKCFDTSFYTKVASNVNENLSKYLDGSFNRFNLEPDNIIKTRKSKNSVAINTVEGFPTLLACEQYSRSVFDSYLPRSIAPRQKWKWEHLDLDKNPINQDQIKRFSHVTNCIITLVSSLDIWTQLCMRDKYEAKFHNTSFREKTFAKQNVICNELKEILESREIPKSSSAIVKHTEQLLPKDENIEFARSLGLVPRRPTVEITPAKLSGECVRPRCFICCACGERIPDYKTLRLHKSTQHPNAQVAHYEIVGKVLLDADIMKHLYVPPPQLNSSRSRPPRGIKECTKCNKQISLEDLHQHILDCAGDTPVVRRKCRPKTFGARRRRARMPDNTIRKQMRKGIRHRQNTQKNILRSRPKVRTEVGDAETIRKMLADLPAKRHRVTINPVNSSGSRTRHEQNRLTNKSIIRKRAAEDRHTTIPIRMREQNSANKHPRPSRSVTTKEIDASTIKKDMKTKMQRTLIRKAKNLQANVKRSKPNLRSESVRKLRSAMSNTALSKDESTDSNSKNIDLSSGNSCTREHAAHGNSSSGNSCTREHAAHGNLSSSNSCTREHAAHGNLSSGNSCTREHAAHGNLSSGDSCTREHAAHGNLSSSNSCTREHAAHGNLSSGNSCTREHAAHGNLSSGNSCTREHAAHGNLSSGNSCTREHAAHGNLSSGNSCTREHAAHGNLSSGNSCTREHAAHGNSSSGNSSTREHGAQGSSNCHNQPAPDSNDQSRGAQNPPHQDVPPLKHSIARLTASNVTHDKSVQFQPHFLVQQECYKDIDNDHHTFVRVGQPVLFQDDYGECRLDKPPLDSYNLDYTNDNLFYQKNKNNKPRKGLNDCIAMLKNKLVDPIFPDYQTNQQTQRRSVHCDTADMPQYQENTPSTSKESEAAATDHYQTMLSPIPPAHANTNVMSIMSAPLDLSGKGSACISTNSDECYDTLDLSYKNDHDYQSNDDEDVVVDLSVKPVNEPLVTLDLSKKTKATDNPADIDISKMRYPREHNVTEPPLTDMCRVRYQHREHEPPLIDTSIRYQPREHSVTESHLIDTSTMRYQLREHNVTEPPLTDMSRARHQPREYEPPLIDTSKMSYQPREHSMTDTPLIDISRMRHQPWEHSLSESTSIDTSRLRHQPREHSMTEAPLIENSKMRYQPREHNVTESTLIETSRVRHQPREHSVTESTLIDISSVRHRPREHGVTESTLIDTSRVRHRPREHSVTESTLTDTSGVRHQSREHSVTESPLIDNSKIMYQPREHSATEQSLNDAIKMRYQHREHSVTEPPLPDVCRVRHQPREHEPSSIDTSTMRYQSREHSVTEPPLTDISRARHQPREHEPTLIDTSTMRYQPREHSVTESPLTDTSRVRHRPRKHSVTEPPLIDTSKMMYQPRKHSVTETPLTDMSRVRHQSREHSVTESPLSDTSKMRYQPRKHSVTSPPLVDTSKVRYQPREHSVTESLLIDVNKMRYQPQEYSVTSPPLINASKTKYQPREHSATSPPLVDTSKVRYQHREHTVSDPSLIDASKMRYQPREHSVTDPPLTDISKVRLQPREHSVTEPLLIDISKVTHQPREHSVSESPLNDASKMRYQPRGHNVTEAHSILEPHDPPESQNYGIDPILTPDSRDVPPLNIVTTLGGFSQVTTTSNESVTTFTSATINTSPMCKLVSSSTNYDSKKMANTSSHTKDTVCKETDKITNYERPIPSTAVHAATTASHEIQVNQSKENVKSSETDTAKKIAMLPKAIVEILGTMPVDSRNQLLNVLPQYMSHTCTDNKPNLEVETSRETASVPGFLAKTEIATQTAAAIQSDLLLDKSVSESSATTSNSAIIHNIASVSRNCETQIESTIYNNGSSLSNTNITHDFLTRPSNTTPHKTGNEKTASLRAVRIKTLDRLKKLHQLPPLNKNVENHPGHGSSTPNETQNAIVTKLPAIQQAEVSSTHISKIPIAKENSPEREHIPKILEESDINSMDTLSDITKDRKVLKSEEFGTKSNETIQVDEKPVMTKPTSALDTPQTAHNRSKENKILPNFNNNLNSSVVPAKTSDSSNDIEVDKSKTNDDDSEDDISLALIVKQKNQKKVVKKPRNRKPKQKSNSKPKDKDTIRKTSLRKNKESLSNANVEKVPFVKETSQINSETTKPCKTGSQVVNPKRKSRNANTKVIEYNENSTNSLITNNAKEQTSAIRDVEKETMKTVTSEDNLKAKTVGHIIDTYDTNKRGKKTYLDRSEIDIPKDSLINQETSHQKSITESKSQTETAKSKQQLKELHENVKTSLDIQSENGINNFAANISLHESAKSNSELTPLNTIPSEITNLPENIDGNASEQKVKKVVPVDIESNIKTKDDVAGINADDHTPLKSLRRSRRGKSLYTEPLTAIIPVETIPPKATLPLTKKQLIFTKMLLDEENLKADNRKEVSLKSKPSEEEKSNPSLQDVQEKSHKRKSLTPKTISQKKQKTIKTPEKEMLDSTDSDEKLMTKEIETSGTSKKVANVNVENKQCKADALITELLESSKNSIETHNKHEDPQQNNKESAIIDSCKRSSTSSTDVKSNQPEIHQIAEPKPGCSSIKKIKCNSTTAPLLSQTDTDSEVECLEPRSPTNKRDAIKSTCYSNLTTSKRTRSKCLPKTWLENYDPYDIDLEEDVEPVNKKVVNWLKNSQKCAFKSKTATKKANTKKKTKLQAKKSLETSASISPTKNLGNKSEQNDSDDSSKSDVPLTKYVSTKDIANTVPKCLEDDTLSNDQNDKKDIDVKEGSSKECENDHPIPNDSLQEDNPEVDTDNKKKNRGKKKKSKKADNANETNLNEDTERLKSEQFMESFGFFSERKPRKSNLLATKKISETFHNVDDSDDLYSGSKEKTVKKCRRKSSLRDDNKETQTKSTSKKTPTIKKTKFPTDCICSKEKMERRETYCAVCEKQFRRPDNFFRHYFTPFHITRVIKKQMHINIEVVEDKPSFLGVYKEHLQRLIVIADDIDKKNKELILISPDAPQTKVPTIGEILDNARMQTIASQRCGRRGLSTDEALFLDCCEMLNKSELPPAQDHTLNEVPAQEHHTLNEVPAQEHHTLNQVSDNLNPVSDNLNQVSDNLNQVSDNLNQSSDNLNQSSDNLNQVSDNLEQVSDNLDQVSDNLDSRTPTSNVIAAEKCDQKSDEDVDSITARAIMESDEVRNLEKDLLSGFMITRQVQSSNNDTDAIVNSNFETRNSEILSQASMTDCLESEIEYREAYDQAKKSKSNRVGSTNKQTNKSQRKCLKQKRNRTKSRVSICDDSETDSQDIILKKKINPETNTIERDTKIEPGPSGLIRKTDPTFDIECTSKKVRSHNMKHKFIDSNSDLQKPSTSFDAGDSVNKKNKKPKKPRRKPHKKRHSETVKSCRDVTLVDTKDEPFKEVNIFKDETVDIFEDKFDKIKRKALDLEVDVQKTNRKIDEEISKKSQKKSIKAKRRRSKKYSSTREDSDSDTKEEPFQKINIFEDELVDMFEDKFDKIKRKCRSQVAAVKTTPAVVETSKSRQKGKTSVQKKKMQSSETKTAQNIIMTKGALKGFESIKVSIPTTDIDMSAITSTVTENKQRKRKRHTAKKRKVKKYDNDKFERYRSKDSPKHLDVYEFIDDDTDMFEFRPSTIKERFKSTFKDAPSTSKTVPIEKHRDESSSSGTDGDDFVYMSDDYLCSAEDTEAENSEQSSGAQYSCEVKKARKNNTTEKNTVMGKIFKNNAIRTDKKTLNKANDKQKTNLDQLFDSLLEDKPNSFDEKTNNKEKELPATNLSNDDDSVMSFKDLSFRKTNSQSPNPVIDSLSSPPRRKNKEKKLPAKNLSNDDDSVVSYKDLSFRNRSSPLPNPVIDSLSSPPRRKHSINKKKQTKKPVDVLELSSDNSAGVARHRTRRKCAVGKQNVLAESWSSESESEMGHSNSGESVVASGSNKKRLSKRGPSLQAGGKRGRYTVKKVGKTPRKHRRAVINEKYGNDEPPVDHYTWSLSNELLASGHRQQHGWIVGNSHKKLVTLLANAKINP